MDSLRVLTALSMELVSIVPFSAQDTFAYDSQEPVSQLFDSYEDLEQGDVAINALRRQICKTKAVRASPPAPGEAAAPQDLRRSASRAPLLGGGQPAARARAAPQNVKGSHTRIDLDKVSWRTCDYR